MIAATRRQLSSLAMTGIATAVFASVARAATNTKLNFDNGQSPSAFPRLPFNSHDQVEDIPPPKDDWTISGNISDEPIYDPRNPASPTLPSFSSTIERGQKPPARSPDWVELVSRFEAVYKVPSNIQSANDVSKAKVDTQFLVPDARYTFDASTSGSEFRFTSVETLLNEVSNILDRCLSERLEWSDLATKRANLALDLIEFLEKDRLHEEEVIAGAYTIAFKQSGREAQAFTYQSWGAKDAARELEYIWNRVYDSGTLNQIQMVSGVAAGAAANPAYDNPTPGSPITYEVDTYYLTDRQNPTSEHFNFSFPIAGYLKASAEYQHQFVTVSQKRLIHADWCVKLYEYYGAHLRAASFSAKAAWDQKGVEFRLKELSDTRDLAKLKIRLATEPGGALNFAERESFARMRLQNDLGYACSRFDAIVLGLYACYGINIPIPKAIFSALSNSTTAAIKVVAQQSPTGSPDSVALQTLEPLLFWVRKAISSLLSYQQQERYYSIALPLKSLLGAAWKNLNDATGATFKISEASFVGEYGVRLLSVGLTVRGKSPGFWAADVTVPNESYYRHRADMVVPVEQGSILPARLGRVALETEHYPMPIDRATSIHNASPFGIWRLQFRSAEHSPNILDARDVILHLEIASSSSHQR